MNDFFTCFNEKGDSQFVVSFRISFLISQDWMMISVIIYALIIRKTRKPFIRFANNQCYPRNDNIDIIKKKLEI